MIRRKISVELVGADKIRAIDLVSAYQKEKTLRAHITMWDKLVQDTPELQGKDCHFTYDNITKKFFLREGNSENYWFKYTFSL